MLELTKCEAEFIKHMLKYLYEREGEMGWTNPAKELYKSIMSKISEMDGDCKHG